MARKRHSFGEIKGSAEDIIMATNYLRSHGWTYHRMKFDKIFAGVENPEEWFFDSEHLERFNELVAEAAEMRTGWPVWKERVERWYGPVQIGVSKAPSEQKPRAKVKSKPVSADVPAPSFQPKGK